MYNGVNPLAPLFSIGSSSFLQVLTACIKAWMSLIRHLTTELAALERLKLMSPPILFTLAYNTDMYNILDAWTTKTELYVLERLKIPT